MIKIASILFFLILFSLHVKGQEGLPDLSFGESLNLTSEEDGSPFWEWLNNSSLFSKSKGTLEILCEASYPIHWLIQGYLYPGEYVEMQPPQVLILNTTERRFKLKIILFFNTEDGCYSSASFSCKPISAEQSGNIINGSSIKIFVPRDNATLLKEGTLGGSNIPIQNDPRVIHCPSTNPKVAVQLYRLGQGSNKGEDLIEDALYDPLVGFTLPSRFMGVGGEGDFICRAGDSTPEVKVNKPKDKISEPSVQLLKAFTNDELRAYCPNIVKNENKNLWLRQDGVNVLFTSTDPSNGTIFCQNSTLDSQLIKLDYIFLTPPELYLNNFEEEVQCLSEDPARSVSMIRCKEPTHCEYMSHCLQDSSWCNFLRTKQFHSDKPTRCFIEERGAGADCAALPYAYPNALVRCTVSEGLSRTWNVFVSLENIKYFDWRDAPQQALLRMDEVPPILYANQTATFVCIGSAFLFADSLAFSIQFENGSTHPIDESLVSRPGGENGRKIREFNILGILVMNLSIETVGINCLAPWSNSTQFITTQRRFITKYLKSPVISPLAQKSSIFLRNEISRRLECPGEGEPNINYIWSKGGQILNESSGFKLSIGSKGESFLEFPKIRKDLDGAYQCLANNSVGSAQFIFIVHVQEEERGDGTKDWTYGTIIGLTLFILFIVLCLLYFVYRQYNKTKELLRALTQVEIDEFFNGHPELINTNQKLTTETLDLIPYDPKYEIDLNDLDYEESEILGSGEFSYVAKGFLKSESKSVAIKIGKTSADVALFKTLLSELKIMIYIGGHQNIVRLLGASTKNIKNRTIHIILELCEIGSLEKHLRKGRPRFVSLIDGNQSIDINLMGEGDFLSTLHLIRWSAHIAQGMAFLSYKGIVHADLAARNVLLNSKGVAKISDFGLSKKLYENNNYVKKTKSPLPWRWMALESLTTLSFSPESDIWSFGITLWELFTLGDTPFPNDEWNKEFINRVASGMRMGRPKHATSNIYSKIVECWDEDTSRRPPFTQLANYFGDLYSSIEGGGQVPLNGGGDEEEVNEPSLSQPSIQLGTRFDGGEEDKKFEEIPLYENAEAGGEASPNYTNFDPSTGQPLYSNIS